MKYLKFSFLLLIPFIFAACDDFDDDNLDFSNSVDPYVEFNSPSSVTFEPEQAVNLQVVIRSAIQSPLTVNYSVDGVDGFQVTIPENSFSTVISLPGLSTEGQAVVKLLSANSSDSDLSFAIGRGSQDVGLSVTEVVVNWVFP